VARTLRQRTRRARPDGAAAAPGDTAQVLRALEARGVHVTVGLSPGETALKDVQGLPDSPLRTVRRLEGPPDAHTLAPHGLRRQAEQVLDEAVRQLLSEHERVER
jgi:hypothetical protein